MASLEPGNPFPRLSLVDPQGRPVPLADAWANGPLLILLGHSDCGTTLFTLPYLERLHRARPGRARAILQDEPSQAEEAISHLGLTLPVYLEGEPYALAAELGLTTVPTLVLVNRNGKIEYVSEAFQRKDWERFAVRLGAPAPFFHPDDDAPALRPG